MKGEPREHGLREEAAQGRGEVEGEGGGKKGKGGEETEENGRGGGIRGGRIERERGRS